MQIANGPPAAPLVGHLPWFLRDKLGFLRDCAGRYGDVVGLHLGGPTLLVTHPADIRHVLVGNADNYGKSPRVIGPTARQFLGNNIFTSEGSDHQKWRRLLQSTLRGHMLEQAKPAIQGHAESAVSRWLASRTIDATREMRQLALRCALSILIGDEILLGFPEVTALVESRRRYVDAVFSSLLPAAHRWPTPKNLAQMCSHPRLIKILEAAAQAASRSVEPSVLSRLVGNAGVAKEEIVQQMLALSVAAYEGTTELLSWTLYVMASDPRQQDEWQGQGDPEHVQRVLSEVLRLYPPTWLFVRVARRDDTLPSGFSAPAGTKIYLSPFVTQRDGRFFAEPERFDPSRFSPTEASARPAFSYFPFGAGNRSCIGEALVRQEATIILSSLLSRARLRLVSAETVGMRPGITLSPSEVRVSLRVR